MTQLSKLRTVRIVRMCKDYTHYDPSVVSPPVRDEDGRLHWRVSYNSVDRYFVSFLGGVWYICRVDALAICGDTLPDKEDVTLL